MVQDVIVIQISLCRHLIVFLKNVHDRFKMLDTPVTNQNTIKKINGTNDIDEENISTTTTYRKIKPKISSFEVTSELRSQSISLLNDKIIDNANKLEMCNGINSNSDDGVTAAETLKDLLQEPPLNSKIVSPESNGNVVSSSMNNVVVVSSVNKSVTSKDVLKNSKVYVLNGKVMKEANESEKSKTDNINIICFGNVIKKIQCDNVTNKNMKSLINNNNSSGSIIDPEKSKLTQPSMPSFIQLSQSNLKNLSPKITLSVAPQVSSFVPKSVNNFEILRQKLLEKGIDNPTPIGQNLFVTQEVPSLRKSSGNGNSILKKDHVVESSAMAKAKSEFNKCRRLLIQAAIHPQLPTYEPPPGYKGPTYSCEECDDTFSTRESLRKHKDRRSVLFTYACPTCKKVLEFFNRCTFLLHVRSHNAAVKACFLTISTIPADKLNFRLLENNDLISEEASYTTSTMNDQDRPSSPRNIRVIKLSKPKHSIRDRMIGENEEVNDVNNSVVNAEVDKIETSCEVGEGDDHRSSTEDNVIEEKVVATQSRENEKSKRKIEEIRGKFKNKKRRISKSNSSSEKLLNAANSTTSISNTNSVDEKVKTIKTRPIKQTQLKSSDTTKSLKSVEEITLTSSEDEDDIVESDKNNLVTCRECKKDVPNLTAHYRATNRPLKEYPCEQCKFFSPSPCAFAAHVRIHSKSLPFVCPDCGFYFSTFDSFQIHIKQVCFYDFKTIRFKCPECSLLKPSVPLFADHLKRCHIREVFKCSVCITSSYSAKVVQLHMMKMHPENKCHLLEGYRCMLCPNLLVAKQSINVHVKRHVFGLQYLRYVYICKCCRKYASGRRLKFENHYENCPSREREDRLSPSPDKPQLSQQKVNKNITRNRKASTENNTTMITTTGDIEEIEERDPLTIEEWETDKLKAEFLPRTKVCVMCCTTKLNDHSRSLFCNACVSYVNADDPNDSATSSENPQKTDVGRSKRKFKCKLCKQFMNRDWTTITRHYEQDHHADFDVSTNLRSRSTVDAGTVHKRKLSSAKIDSSCAKSPKIDKTGNSEETGKYKCIKCGYITTSRNDFHMHIVSHKAQSNTDYQCLECGECFIVKPSLEKHLIVVHKIRDIKEYYKENKIEDDNEDFKEEKTLVENQCEVCFMECGSKQNYDKHIRTHGMAFVAMHSRAKS